MSREIKFRMWNGVPNNVDKEGYFHDTITVIGCLQQQLFFDENNQTEIGYNHIGDGSFFEQSTGLKGENGVNIFEGDIIISKDTGTIFQVVYDSRTTSFLAQGLKDEWDDFLYKYDSKKLKVIGNIHQNPELL